MAIGGYFEVELPVSSDLIHARGIHVNSGRNALKLILQHRNFKKVFLPRYTCDAVLNAVRELEIQYEFYNINLALEPEFDFNSMGMADAFICNNYFGLKDDYINKLIKLKNILIDNCQSLYSIPLPEFDSFYSPRKFLGVSDGGYAYLRKNESLPPDVEFEQDFSYNRFSYLVERIDVSPEYGYTNFQESEKFISALPLRKMSQLTQRILNSVNYEFVAKQRWNNFNMLHNKLSSLNLIQLPFNSNSCSVPLCYPLLTKLSGLRTKLMTEKIFCPQYWPNVKDWSEEGSNEYFLYSNLIPLPIDQRYGEEAMVKVSEVVLECFEKNGIKK